MAALDPDFIEAYLAFRSVPQNNGPLEQKYKELILIAINAATTHLYGPGVRRHIQNAFRAGATKLSPVKLSHVVAEYECEFSLSFLRE